MPYKMLVCDDIKYMCQYFETIFNDIDDFEVVGTADTKNKIIKKLKELHPDVMLLDIQMDTSTTGLDLIPYIKSYYPDTKIVMLTVNEQRDVIFKALELGADNYILKTNDIPKIVEIVTRTCKGDVLFEGIIAKKIIEKFHDLNSTKNSLLFVTNLLTNLSKVELSIVNMLCNGYTPKEIAKKRFVEYSTIRSQLTVILKKTGYKNYKQLVHDICQSGAVAYLSSIQE